MVRSTPLADSVQGVNMLMGLLMREGATHRGV